MKTNNYDVRELVTPQNLEARMQLQAEAAPNNYAELKSKYAEYILLFKTANFYETYAGDAIALSEALGLELHDPLRSRNYFLCGFPLSHIDRNLRALVKQGVKVALCEQN